MNSRRWIRFSLSIILLFLLSGTIKPHSIVSAKIASIPVPQWTSQGPYADDATAVAVSPNYDGDHTVFMGVSYQINLGQPTVQGVAAILRSTNGGATWSSVYTISSAVGTTFEWLTQIVVSPDFSTDGTVFATLGGGTTNGVLRSTNGGTTFQALNVGTTGFDGANKTLSISPGYGTDHTIAATVSAGKTAVSYLSIDGGTTWNTVTPHVSDACAGTLVGGGFLLALGNNNLGSFIPNSNLVCSNNTDELYAVSHNGGTTWSKAGDIQGAIAGANNFDDQHSRMYAAPNGSAILYTDQYGNVVQSPDGGTTWNNLITPTSILGHDAPPGAASATGPYYVFQFKTAMSVYAVHEWSKAPPEIFHSGNGGATWSILWKANGATTLHDLVAAGASSIFFAGGNLGLLRSNDLAQNWKSVGSFMPSLPSVAVSPNFVTDHALFTVSYPSGIVTTGGQDQSAFGIYNSTDGGSTWNAPESPNQVLGDIWTTATNGGLSLDVSPNYATDHTVFEGDNIGAVDISHDGGLNWTVSLLGAPPQAGWYIDDLKFSPGFGADHTVYLGLGNLGFGAAKSNDGGQTWGSIVPADRFIEITQASTRSLAVSQEVSGTIDVGIGMSGSLFLAKDTPAAMITPEWAGMNFADTWAIAMSPTYQSDCTMFIAMWPGPSGVGATLDDGVYRSTDACLTGSSGTVHWTRMTGSLPTRDFDAIVLSPNFSTDHTLFIGGWSSGVWMSQDAGQTWIPFSAGLGNQTIHKLAVAKTADQVGILFAATDAGLWQTPVPLVTSILKNKSIFLPLVMK